MDERGRELDDKRLTSMSTNVENRIKLARAGQHVRQFVRVGPQGLLLVQEGGGSGVGLEHLHGAWVERSLSALGRSDGQFGLALQDFVGVGEFGLSFVSEVHLSWVLV